MKQAVVLYMRPAPPLWSCANPAFFAGFANTVEASLFLLDFSTVSIASHFCSAPTDLDSSAPLPMSRR
jgi:hypothetical protein